jgi:hypothetical protein
MKLPKWQSHKIVEADRITATLLTNETGKTPWIWILDCGARIEVSLALKNRVPTGVDPLAGYYVRYADGFESWSPSQAFEKGYSLITPLDGPTCEARADVIKGVKGDLHE